MDTTLPSWIRFLNLFHYFVCTAHASKIYDSCGCTWDSVLSKDRRVLTTKQRETAMKAFLRSFSAQEFILEFVQDINQDKGSGRAGLVRNFGLKKLCQWVSEHKKESFDPYSIYYDEKKSSE